MLYGQARLELKTGDVVAIDTRNPITKAVQRLFTRSKYDRFTHIWILIWRGDHLHVVEMDGRYNVERPLSQYANAGKQILAFRLPVDQAKISKSIDLHMRDEIHYDYGSFFSIGARLAFGIGIADNPKKLVCTDFVLNILKTADIDPLKDQVILGNKYLMTPSELCWYLDQPIIQIN